MLSRLHHGLRRHRHTAFLACIVIGFLIRPVIGGGQAVAAAFSLAMIALLLLALYAISIDELIGDREHLRRRRRRRHLVAWVLAAPAALERILALTVLPSTHFYLASAGCWMLFLGYVTWIELRTVLEQRQVTGETMSMAITVYLLMGITWAMLYFAIFELDPQALSFQHFPGSSAEVAPTGHTHLLLFIYFSFSTLSTLGFGDIMPVSLPARYAAVAESITGQLYLAILVARLVSMQLGRSKQNEV